MQREHFKYFNCGLGGGLASRGYQMQLRPNSPSLENKSPNIWILGDFLGDFLNVLLPEDNNGLNKIAQFAINHTIISGSNDHFKILDRLFMFFMAFGVPLSPCHLRSLPVCHGWPCQYSNTTANIAVKVLRWKLKTYHDVNARTPSAGLLLLFWLWLLLYD